MVFLNALYMVLIRTYTDADPVLAGAASGSMLFAAGWLFADLADVSARDATLLVIFGLVFAGATVLWIEGTKLSPAAESGLLGSAETPIAIAMAWIILSETPCVSGSGPAAPAPPSSSQPSCSRPDPTSHQQGRPETTRHPLSNAPLKSRRHRSYPANLTAGERGPQRDRRSISPARNRNLRQTRSTTLRPWHRERGLSSRRQSERPA